jgi:hypothetical protein
VELGGPGYDESWFFADLRGKEYRSASIVGDDIQEEWVSALVIAHQRRRDGALGGFLLVEINEDAAVIDDWFHGEVDDAKAHGSELANEELAWQPVPDTDDIRGYVRGLLRASG